MSRRLHAVRAGATDPGEGLQTMQRAVAAAQEQTSLLGQHTQLLLHQQLALARRNASAEGAMCQALLCQRDTIDALARSAILQLEACRTALWEMPWEEGPRGSAGGGEGFRQPLAKESGMLEWMGGGATPGGSPCSQGEEVRTVDGNGLESEEGSNEAPRVPRPQGGWDGRRTASLSLQAEKDAVDEYLEEGGSSGLQWCTYGRRALANTHWVRHYSRCRYSKLGCSAKKVVDEGREGEVRVSYEGEHSHHPMTSMGPRKRRWLRAPPSALQVVPPREHARERGVPMDGLRVPNHWGRRSEIEMVVQIADGEQGLGGEPSSAGNSSGLATSPLDWEDLLSDVFGGQEREMQQTEMQRDVPWGELPAFATVGGSGGSGCNDLELNVMDILEPGTILEALGDFPFQGVSNFEVGL